MIRRLEVVRIKGQEKGGINEFGRVFGKDVDGRYFVSNLNMPFQGTISALFERHEIEGESEWRSETVTRN